MLRWRHGSGPFRLVGSRLAVGARVTLWRSIGILAAAVAACDARALGPTSPCVHTDVPARFHPIGPLSIDLLVVLDERASTQPARARLARELPPFVRGLATGDRDGDGLRDHAAPSSVRIGVISADLGAAGAAVFGCVGDGAEARLDRRPASCGVPDVFSFGLDAGDADALACSIERGVTECQIPQPLEAMRIALERPTDHRLGQGSSLGVLLLTDADDLSVTDPNLFSVTDPETLDVPASVRAVRHPEALHPIERYVELLATLRAPARDVVFSLIGGLPRGAHAFDREGLDAVLSEPSMTPIVRDEGRALATLCDDATPSRRIVEAARGAAERGVSTSISSICEDDHSVALARMGDSLTRPLAHVCLPRPVPRADDGTVQCALIEFRSVSDLHGGACDEARGRTLIDVVEDDGESVLRCRVRQARGPDDGPGWYADDASGRDACAGARIGYTPGAGPRLDTWFGFTCAREVCRDAGATGSDGGRP